MNEMRAQRAHHEGAKVQRSGSSPPWNQHKGPRLITREEMERRLWPDRNVNFDHSLDVVVSRLRTVLGDKGPSSRYIETVPTKGYRFIEPVTAKPEARRANRHWRRQLVTYAAVAILAAILAILFARTRYDKLVRPDRSRASATVPAR